MKVGLFDSYIPRSIEILAKTIKAVQHRPQRTVGDDEGTNRFPKALQRRQSTKWTHVHASDYTEDGELFWWGAGNRSPMTK